MPGIAVKVLYGEMAEMVTTGQRALPARLRRLGYEFAHPELEEALRDVLEDHPVPADRAWPYTCSEPVRSSRIRCTGCSSSSRRRGTSSGITPPWLHFEVRTPEPVRMEVGALIDYRLHYRGVPVGWTSQIEVWEPGRQFVDRQLRGPYGLWHHRHTFSRDRRAGR